MMEIGRDDARIYCFKAVEAYPNNTIALTQVWDHITIKIYYVIIDLQMASLMLRENHIDLAINYSYQAYHTNESDAFLGMNLAFMLFTYDCSSLK